MQPLRTSVVARIAASGIAASVIACSASSAGDEENAAAGEYTFCGARRATCSARYAGQPNACTKALREECEALEPAFSQGARDAVVLCGRLHSPCVVDFEKCVDRMAVKGPPTEAQARVRDAFCEVCRDAAQSGAVGPCSTFFDTDADAGVGIYGVGAAILKVNDAIARQIGDRCVGAQLDPQADGGVVTRPPASGSTLVCDPLAFAACVYAIVRENTSPSACR
jgi:hypothetical protein